MAEPDLRELIAVREISAAFLTAERPEDVFTYALGRVSPVVGATFASVYLIDGGSELMRLVAAYNWPKRYEPWLGQMRVRLGFGPSGEAASERRAIEVPDVQAGGGLEDWQDVAAELGFRALIALPLQTARGVLGTVTFYFAEAGAFSSERKGLLRMVAGQMAATAEKMALIDQLRGANAALTESKTELERQVLAVLDARRVKDEFLTNITHELRTPLAAVMGYLSLLQEEYSGPLTEHQRNDVGMAREASERLLGLIDMLLEITMGTQPSAVRIEEFDPREPIRDAVATTRGRTMATGLELIEPSEPVQRMRSDRGKITKILGCLLDNAYKFTASGTVSISLRVDGQRAMYRVCDTGIGIPSEAHAFVFEDFRQVDGSLTRQYGGAGLGLTLARRLARLLGGDITLESALGEGATFSVDLPLHLDLVIEQVAR